MKFDTTLNRLRTTGTWEAISYLALLGIAMPMKYAFDMPLAVRIVGMAHGLLWMLYVGLTFLGQLDYKWSFKTRTISRLSGMEPGKSSPSSRQQTTLNQPNGGRTRAFWCMRSAMAIFRPCAVPYSSWTMSTNQSF